MFDASALLRASSDIVQHSDELIARVNQVEQILLDSKDRAQEAIQSSLGELKTKIALAEQKQIRALKDKFASHRSGLNGILQRTAESKAQIQLLAQQLSEEQTAGNQLDQRRLLRLQTLVEKEREQLQRKLEMLNHCYPFLEFSLNPLFTELQQYFNSDETSVGFIKTTCFLPRDLAVEQGIPEISNVRHVIIKSLIPEAVSVAREALKVIAKDNRDNAVQLTQFIVTPHNTLQVPIEMESVVAVDVQLYGQPIQNSPIAISVDQRPVALAGQGAFASAGHFQQQQAEYAASKRLAAVAAFDTPSYFMDQFPSETAASNIHRGDDSSLFPSVAAAVAAAPPRQNAQETATDLRGASLASLARPFGAAGSPFDHPPVLNNSDDEVDLLGQEDMLGIQPTRAYPKKVCPKTRTYPPRAATPDLTSLSLQDATQSTNAAGATAPFGENGGFEASIARNFYALRPGVEPTTASRQTASSAASSIQGLAFGASVAPHLSQQQAGGISGGAFDVDVEARSNEASAVFMASPRGSDGNVSISSQRPATAAFNQNIIGVQSAANGAVGQQPTIAADQQQAHSFGAKPPQNSAASREANLDEWDIDRAVAANPPVNNASASATNVNAAVAYRDDANGGDAGCCAAAAALPQAAGTSRESLASRPDLKHYMDPCNPRRGINARMVYSFGTPDVSTPDENETFDRPIGCTFNEEEQRYVICDTFHNVVKIFDANKDPFIMLTAGAEGNFQRPSAVLYAPDMNAYIIKDDKSIGVFSYEGRPLREFGRGYFRQPYGLARDRHGLVYTIDEINRNAKKFKLYRFDPRQADCVPESFTFEGTGCRFMDVGSNDRIVAADYFGHNASITDLQGKLIRRFGSVGRNDGQMNGPSGVIVDANGIILMGDSRNNRIQIFDADGNYLSQIVFDTAIRCPSNIHLTASGELMVMNYARHFVSLHQLEHFDAAQSSANANLRR